MAAKAEGGSEMEFTLEEKLRDLLEEAIHLMQEWSDNHEGFDPFGIPCPNCDAAVPMRHSFGCRAAAVLSLASHRRESQ
jgi:hypothetical protein